MRTEGISRNGRQGRLGHFIYASGLLVPLLFVVIAVCFTPLTSHHELDADEGIETMKSLLVSRGYALYTEVWDELPPVFTTLLAQWLRWFGNSLTASRALVLLFSALLLWAFYQTVRLAVSELAALISVALLVLSHNYVRLSISVMIGLPAVALAMLSIYLLVVGQRRRSGWLTVGSGLVLGLSLQTKLFTGVLVPVILIYLLFLNETGTSQVPGFRRRLGTCALWLAVVWVVFVATGLLVGTLDPKLLITPHLGGQARTASYYERFNSAELVVDELLVYTVYLPLVVLGIFWGFKRRIPTLGLALGWLAVSLPALLFQRPLWYHHFLLMAVPLAWLSAFGVEAALHAFGLRDRGGSAGGRRWPRRLVWLSGMLIVGGLVIFNLVSRLHEIPSELGLRGRNERIVDRFRQAACLNAAWVFTDRPIYAFEAGVVVPPPLAVTSRKRFLSGEMTEDMLLDVLRSYRPKFVALERFYADWSQNFRESLAEDYVLLEEYRDKEDKPVAQLLFARPLAVAGDAGQAPTRVVFDDWLTLEWTPPLIGGQVKAGACSEMPGLVWRRPAAHPGEDLGLSLRLQDREGNVLAQHDEPLGTDYNTIRDRAQLPYWMDLPIPEGTPPGDYDLILVVYDPKTGRPLPATGAGAAAGGGAMLGQVRVDRPSEPVPLRPALADFGPLRLITADSPATAVSPGDEIPLDLLWQADRDHHGESLVVVAQLLDERGNVVAGLEEEPLDGHYGTAGWQPGELVRDQHTLTAPSNTPPGRYDLIVGLYRLPTRERLRTQAGPLGLRSRDYYVLRQIEVR